MSKQVTIPENVVKSRSAGPYEAELSSEEKFWKKAKDAPFVPIGIIGAVSMLGWGAYKFRHKGQMSTSMYLMHLRVQTQSMIVGALAAGVAYSLLKNLWKKNHPEQK